MNYQTTNLAAEPRPGQTTAFAEPSPIHEHGLRRFSTACWRQIKELKDRLTVELNTEFGGLLNSAAVRQAVNEADALASITLFPTLFLPDLAEEKARLASRWQAKQHLIKGRTLSFAA